jgi:7-carboxy-7-deazaguanine synthase
LKEKFLKINELYLSLQGESSWAGLPCIFVRLSGCNLRCSYCDSSFSYKEGKEYSIEEIAEKINSYRCKLVEITGGEPLLQENTALLAKSLCDAGYRVLIETNGTIDIGNVDRRVILIMDIKTPGSGSNESVRWENIKKLKKDDEVKFVLTNKKDYLWAKDIIKQYGLADRASILISVVYGSLEPKEVAQWILDDGLDVRFQLQLHKYIWDPEKKGV